MNSIWSRLVLWIVALVTVSVLGSSSSSQALVSPSMGSVSGVVLDLHRHPVAGAHVEVVDDHHHTVDSTTTGRHGLFHFPHLDPGTYTVFASKPGVGHGSAYIVVHAGHETQVHVVLH